MSTAFEVASHLRQNLQRHQFGRQADFRSIGPRDHGAWEFDVRYWGHWENPQGCEDEQDYDWQVPTQQTADHLKVLVKQTLSLYPSFSVDFQVEEKNWITVLVSPQQST